MSYIHNRSRAVPSLQERQLKSGLSETLKLTVALPLLFGVPPQLEVLDDAIKSGGGIIDRVYKAGVEKPPSLFLPALWRAYDTLVTCLWYTSARYVK